MMESASLSQPECRKEEKTWKCKEEEKEIKKIFYGKYVFSNNLNYFITCYSFISGNISIGCTYSITGHFKKFFRKKLLVEIMKVYL